MRYPVAIETGGIRRGNSGFGGQFLRWRYFGRCVDGPIREKPFGRPFPAPTPIEQLEKKRNYRGWTWAVVDIDASELGDKAARINSTLPQRILPAIDAHARKQGETRSGFLARAALDAMRKPG